MRPQTTRFCKFACGLRMTPLHGTARRMTRSFCQCTQGAVRAAPRFAAAHPPGERLRTVHGNLDRMRGRQLLSKTPSVHAHAAGREARRASRLVHDVVGLERSRLGRPLRAPRSATRPHADSVGTARASSAASRSLLWRLALRARVRLPAQVGGVAISAVPQRCSLVVSS